MTDGPIRPDDDRVGYDEPPRWGRRIGGLFYDVDDLPERDEIMAEQRRIDRERRDA